MKQRILFLTPALVVSALVAGCSRSTDYGLSPKQPASETLTSHLAGAAVAPKEVRDPAADVSSHGPNFVHGLVVDVDGEDYYLAGPPDGPNGATDIPGHAWAQVQADRLIGKHYNTGPFGAPSWWSSDAGDGVLLYVVHARIDTWTVKKAAQYAARGFVHYHELVRVSDGTLHPRKVLWLKHIAVRSFNLDGGPHPEFAHYVTPGVDRQFIPNGMMPYNPES